MATGGKFADGAYSAAFFHLFNNELKSLELLLQSTREQLRSHFVSMSKAGITDIPITVDLLMAEMDSTRHVLEIRGLLRSSHREAYEMLAGPHGDTSFGKTFRDLNAVFTIDGQTIKAHFNEVNYIGVGMGMGMMGWSDTDIAIAVRVWKASFAGENGSWAKTKNYSQSLKFAKIGANYARDIFWHRSQQVAESHIKKQLKY